MVVTLNEKNKINIRTIKQTKTKQYTYKHIKLKVYNYNNNVYNNNNNNNVISINIYNDNNKDRLKVSIIHFTRNVVIVDLQQRHWLRQLQSQQNVYFNFVSTGNTHHKCLL